MRRCRVSVSSSPRRKKWRPQASPSAYWRIPARDNQATVWMADLPTEVFHGYNPFLARDVYDYMYIYGQAYDSAC